MNKPTCRTCVYWQMKCLDLDKERFDAGCDVSGRCHKHALEQPDRYSDWWCGEHNDFPRYVALMSEQTNATHDDIKPISHEMPKYAKKFLSESDDDFPFNWVLFQKGLDEVSRIVQKMSTVSTASGNGGAG